MAYNHGREDRKWRIWKEAEEKVLREHGVDEAVIEQIRMEDRADFNSNRRFYRWTSDFGEYLEGMADAEQQAEPDTVADLLDEIEDEKLYQALLTVDKHTLLILLLKMQGYSTREIAAVAGLTERAVYKRLERLRKKLKPIFYTKEINLISWNGKEPKYDIRSFSPNREKCGKGITLTADEAAALLKALQEELNSGD